MKRVILAVVMGLAAVSCGDTEEPGDKQMPTYTECVPVSQSITTMAGLEALGASGCDSIYVLTINGPSITSLEPLRGFKRVTTLNIENTMVATLEPLRGLQDVQGEVRFNENPKLSYCEITGWIALIKTRDPNRNFGSTVDNPKQNDPCATVNYP